MKILHTSDWHIGRMLYGRKRYEEFDAFLNWMAETVERQQVDVLLIAGDIFDTSTPSNRAQTLYYRFLCRVASSACRHVVVIAGNHDSPSFLSAPQALLRTLDVHVVGAVPSCLEDEVLPLAGEGGLIELIVCAVPYLRDRDIRLAEAGESIEDKERKLINGVRDHYAKVVEFAEQQQKALSKKVPIVAMGHLFAAGGQTAEGEGMRDLYVGSLGHVTAAIFPEAIDYLALGHLHVPQKVAGSELMRYSGSPLAMGFGEAKQVKSVCLVEFDGENAQIEPVVSLLNVPVFQKLERIRGSWAEIQARINALSTIQASTWLEVIYDGEEVLGDLRERIEAAVLDTSLAVLRVKNNRIIDRVLNQINDHETLDDLDENDVFERCLNQHNIPDAQRPELLRAYGETLVALFDDEAKDRP